jgi:nicotinate-nucleotide pyrophosphorylase
LENKRTELDGAAKIKENHLRTINKTLRDEIRKINKVQEEIINIEYLRNVIIKFLEKRNTRVSVYTHPLIE